MTHTAAGIQTVYLTVRDLDAALVFWRRLVGPERALVPWNGDGTEQGAFFELADGTRLIVSYERARVPTRHRQHVWVELLCDDPAAFHDELVAEGFAVAGPPAPTAGGSLAFTVRDPDGNEARVGTRWSLPAAGATGT